MEKCPKKSSDPSLGFVFLSILGFLSIFIGALTPELSMLTRCLCIILGFFWFTIGLISLVNISYESSTQPKNISTEATENPKPMKASEVLSQFAECYRLLEEDGFRFKYLQRIIQNADLRKQIIRLCEPEEKPAEPLISQSTSLEELISSRNFGYVNSNITEANFPDLPTGQAGIGVNTQDPKVYHFNKDVSRDYVLKEMEKDGYRPANLRELLIWMLTNWNGKDWVFALGQVWQGSSGYLNMPYLHEWSGGRGLSLFWPGFSWDSYFRFLAFRRRTKA